MKLIIEIPDEDYKFIKDLQFYTSGRRSGRTIERNVINGIKNGKSYEDRPQDEWIPVSERLPERYKEVIVTDIETSDTYQSQYLGNGYWECDNGTLKNRIIAWMPLPEPYKEAENDNS